MLRIVVLAAFALAVSSEQILDEPRPTFSWATLPVYFHSCNTSGRWSDAAVKAIGRYPLVTFEKVMGSGTAEVNIPAACTQIKKSGAKSKVMYYLNSLIDYSRFTPLHDLMENHPEYRLKDSKGEAYTNPFLFNLSVDAFRELWIADVVTATKNGCDGAFIDKSRTGGPGGAAYESAHTKALAELNTALKSQGKFAINNNQGGLAGADLLCT
jgi:hypothetical protein